MSTAFITGCSSGFGRALAARLLSEGWHVAAGAPALDGLASRLAPDPATRERLLLLKIDLADPSSVRIAARDAIEWSPPDLLVNNAGYAVFATQEEADLQAVERMFQVNVLGTAWVTRALLPTLRERRGTIVQISSVAGRMAFAESGFYAATKHALEAMTEALFVETCTFGLKVRLVEPGSFDTGFLDRARRESEPRRDDSPYARLHDTWDAHKFDVLEDPQDPALVVDAILDSLEDEAPFCRVPVGPDAERILALRTALEPDAWVRLMGQRHGLPTLRPAGAGEVLDPMEVLTLAPDAPDDEVEPTLAALRHGHLDHWQDDPTGQQALERLRDWPPEPPPPPSLPEPDAGEE